MKTTFKRVACFMMSSLIVTSGFGFNKAAAWNPFKTDPLNKSLQDADQIRKKEMSNDVRLMTEAFNIFCEFETYESISEEQQKNTVQQFFRLALQGMNTLGLDLKVANKSGGIEGAMESYFKGMLKGMDKKHAAEEGETINEFAKIVVQKLGNNPACVDPDTNKLRFPPEEATPETKNQFFGPLYNETRVLFKGCIEQRIPRMKEELSEGPMATVKRLMTNPLVIIGGVSIALKTGADAFEAIRGLATELAHHAKNLYHKATAKGFDLDHYPELLERIEKRLRKELVGQDEAIDRIINIMGGYFQSMLEARDSNRNFEGGLMLYLTGSPATGKSTVMKIIREEMHLDSFEAKMSDVVEDKGNKAATVAARLTKPSVVNISANKTISVQTPLMQKLYQYMRPLYGLDEVDKMRKLDMQLQNINANNNQLQNINNLNANTNSSENNKNNINTNNFTINSIDELIRNFIDTGDLAGVNASGSILIVTSNETDEDMKHLDPSLYNRYSQYRVKFKDFDKEDYKEIIKRGSKEVQEHYKSAFKAKIEWSEEALDYFATKFTENKVGGRCAEPLIMKVRRALAVLRKDTDIKNKELTINISDQYDGDYKGIIVE